MKSRFKAQKEFYYKCLFGMLLLIGIGYAVLHTDLGLDGAATFKKPSWDIEWATPTVTSGSVSGANVTTPATLTGTDNDVITYAVTLPNPRDYYEFTVAAKNEGAIDAMISNISIKAYDTNETEVTMPDYITVDVKYVGGAKVEKKQYLKAGESETFKVRLSYNDEADNEDYPTSDITYLLKLKITYVPADNTAIEVTTPGFNNDTSWAEFIAGIRDGSITPEVGDTKDVYLGQYGTHTLRVSNTSTPSECYDERFSETACGLVLEFDDIITKHVMNTSNTNVGGWPASEMKTFLNNDIYNEIPSPLKEAIIDTRTVSGHGETPGETNFFSTDKIYLLSAREVWNYIGDYDTANGHSRQLDYYQSQNVTTNSYTKAKKKYNNSYTGWWLRTAINNRSTSTEIYEFSEVFETGYYESRGASYVSNGVSPAFRIT